MIFYDCDDDNGTGNADGLVSSECGWRYLEAASEDLGSSAFGYFRESDAASNQAIGTNTGIGAGKSNTEALVAAMGDEAYSADSGPSKTPDYSTSAMEVQTHTPATTLAVYVLSGLSDQSLKAY